MHIYNDHLLEISWIVVIHTPPSPLVTLLALASACVPPNSQESRSLLRIFCRDLCISFERYRSSSLQRLVSNSLWRDSISKASTSSQLSGERACKLQQTRELAGRKWCVPDRTLAEQLQWLGWPCSSASCSCRRQWRTASGRRAPLAPALLALRLSRQRQAPAALKLCLRRRCLHQITSNKLLPWMIRPRTARGRCPTGLILSTTGTTNLI